MAVRALFLHRVGLVLHGFLDQQALQAQGGLANVLFDKAQALFGMLLHLLQALAEVFPPVGDVLFEHAILTAGRRFHRPAASSQSGEARAILRQINRHGHRENDFRGWVSSGLR